MIDDPDDDDLQPDSASKAADPDDLDLDGATVVSLDAARSRKTKAVRSTAKKSGGDDDEPPRPRGFVDPETCPVKCLGKNHREFVFLTPSGAVKSMTAPELFRTPTLSELFDGKVGWLKDNCPSDKPAGFNATFAGTLLIQWCVRLGWFNPDTGFRARGVWRLDDLSLLVHLGDKIHRYGADGRFVEAIDAGVKIGNFVYPEHPADPRPAKSADAATAAEMRDFFDLLSSWNWTRPHDAEAVMGWVGAAMLCGALSWRPHLWVGGLPASGKSALERFLRGLFGRDGVVRAAEPSRAYIVDALAGAARPVFLDELERNIDPAKQDMIIELSRLASTDDQSGIGRSSLSGRVTHKPLRAAMYFSAVARPPMRAQDLRRIFVTQLLPLPEATDESRERLARIKATTEAFGARMRARAIAAWPRFRANMIMFEAAIAKVFARSGGVVDQLGTLLSMFHALIRDEPVTMAQAEQSVAGFDVESVTGDSDSAEPMQCAIHLLSSSVKIDVEKGHMTTTIGQLIAEAATAGEGAEFSTQDKLLRRFGLRLEMFNFSGACPELCLLIANHHQGLEDVFKGSRWAQGVWAQFFDRPLGEPTASPAKFAGVNARARRVPLRRLPGSLDDERAFAIEQRIRDAGFSL